MALVQEIAVPLIAVNDTTLTIVEMNFSNGQLVRKGDAVITFETSKTTYGVEAEAEGYIEYLCELNKDYAVNDIVVKIFSSVEEVKTTPQKKAPLNGNAATTKVAAAKTEKQWSGETVFSHKALELIEQKQLSREVFQGYDFVGKDDVNTYLGIPVETKQVKQKGIAKANGSQPKVIAVDTAKAEQQKLSSNKKREISYLSDVQAPGLTSTLYSTIEVDNIFTNLNQSLKTLKNSLLPIVIYETGRLLKKYPSLNGYFAGDSIALFNDVKVGFAIDIEKGLKVLGLEQTNKLTVTEIEEKILSLSNDYIDDKLRIEDLSDITFTITDLSGLDVAFFKPLVNMQNSAILGIGAIDAKLQRCTLALTFDHRVTEGKLVGEFLTELKKRIESYRPKGISPKNVTCFKCLKELSEDTSGIGFVKCITPQGEEAYICQSCIAGF
jgi:pyruvate/2-oxoglutarate dehydrogenase complex dihydrolipoamide acyltransferase (E2) component